MSIQDGELVVSSIYEWFQEDFGGSDAGLIEHLRQYAEPELKKKLQGFDSIGDHRYDWTLNDLSEEKSKQLCSLLSHQLTEPETRTVVFLLQLQASMQDMQHLIPGLNSGELVSQARMPAQFAPYLYPVALA